MTWHHHKKAISAWPLPQEGNIHLPSRYIPVVLHRNIACYRTLSTTNTSHMGNSLSSRRHDHRQHGKSNSHNTARCIHGHSDQNTENVTNSNSSTTNVRANKEPWRIQAWLSLLEPYGRHQDVSNRRLDGVGDWVLQKNEFKAWCKSQNCSVNPTLLCYGGQGVGKTYMRYGSIFRNNSGCWQGIKLVH